MGQGGDLERKGVRDGGEKGRRDKGEVCVIRGF